MTCTQVLRRLDDYVDGLLSPRERDAVCLHLQSCEACRSREEGLVDLLGEARDLARPVEPPADLWPAIAGRIEADRAPREDAERKWAHIPGLRWLGLAAAAFALVAGSALVTAWLVGGGREKNRTFARGNVQVLQLSTLGPDGVRMTRERRQLLAVFRARKASLQPSTVEVVEKNLHIIDRSLAEIESALKQDPGNRDLTYLLAGTYRQELDLLRQAVQLSNDDWTGGNNEKS